jgi:hypothetical protein
MKRAARWAVPWRFWSLRPPVPRPSPWRGPRWRSKKSSLCPGCWWCRWALPCAFPNRDSVRHHVYSFSPAKKFELKLYTGTPANPVVFDRARRGHLGCNIHDQMVGWIVVVDTPYYAQARAATGTGTDQRRAGRQLQAARLAPPHGPWRAAHEQALAVPATGNAARCGQAGGVAALMLEDPRRSLILRLVGVSLLLLLIVQLAGFAVVRAGIDRNARSQIARELDTDENVWLRLLEQNAERCARARPCWRPTTGFGRRFIRATRKPSSRCWRTMAAHRRRSHGAAGYPTWPAFAADGCRDFQAACPLWWWRRCWPAQPQGSQMAVMGACPTSLSWCPCARRWSLAGC